MKRNLSVMKNMVWALSIILCLLVLFVALIIAAALPYSGPIQRGGVQLNELDSEPAEEAQQKEEIILSELRTLPESQDAGQGYIDGLTFLCDSSVIGLRDYALLAGGTATTQGRLPDPLSGGGRGDQPRGGCRQGAALPTGGRSGRRRAGQRG